MERIEIPEEKRTPYVLFDGDKAILEIRGQCTPEHAEDFFAPVKEAMDVFKEDYDYPLLVIFDFTVFNTPTAKQIFAIANKAVEIPSIIKWMYEEDDEDMREAGEDIASLVKQRIIFEVKED